VLPFCAVHCTAVPPFFEALRDPEARRVAPEGRFGASRFAKGLLCYLLGSQRVASYGHVDDCYPVCRVCRDAALRGDVNYRPGGRKSKLFVCTSLKSRIVLLGFIFGLFRLREQKSSFGAPFSDNG
jgi:hypothetical protein